MTEDGQVPAGRELVPLPRRVFAEGLGTALLLAVIIGSGIAAQRLSPDDPGLELLENATATAAGLAAIILMVGPVSGAHLNPLITLVDALFGGIRWADAAAYISAQLIGAAVGAVTANAMFGLSPVQVSGKIRPGWDLTLAEGVATFGLLLVVFAVARSGRTQLVAGAVGAYIGSAYFFTASTSFANPAVTLARMLSNTFAGIAPGSVPGFLLGQLGGSAAALVAIRLLYPQIPSAARRVVIPVAEPTAVPPRRSTHD